MHAAGDRLVLIDAGIGPRSGVSMSGSGTFAGGELLNSLSKQQIAPADITDVIFTHLHFDHVGWASHNGAIVFPNATFRCDARDWEHFRENERVQPILEPIRDRLVTWQGSGPLCPGIDTMSAPGHTPGSTILVLSSAAARGLLVGDVVHCPVELLDDEWAGLGDVDPELAKRTRNALAREIEGDRHAGRRRALSRDGVWSGVGQRSARVGRLARAGAPPASRPRDQLGQAVP